MSRLPAIRSRRSSIGAFTLGELLVSMAVLALLTGVLISVARESSRAWQIAEGLNERNRNGRVLADFIAQELRNAMLPAETVAAPGNPNLQFLINPPPAMVPREYQNPDCIFWQAPIATEQSLGDLAEVGYFVKWEDTAEGPLPTLRRFFVNPTVMDRNARKWVSNENFLIYREYLTWLKPELLQRVAPADAESGYAGLLAENVAGLWIRFFGVDGREITTGPESTELATSFDSRKGYVPSGTPGGLGTARRYLPFQVAVSFVQFDSRLKSLLARNGAVVRELANTPKIRDAREFEREAREAAKQHPGLRNLLPGMRIFETVVTLENAR